MYVYICVKSVPRGNRFRRNVAKPQEQFCEIHRSADERAIFFFLQTRARLAIRTETTTGGKHTERLKGNIFRNNNNNGDCSLSIQCAEQKKKKKTENTRRGSGTDGDEVYVCVYMHVCVCVRALECYVREAKKNKNNK